MTSHTIAKLILSCSLLAMIANTVAAQERPERKDSLVDSCSEPFGRFRSVGGSDRGPMPFNMEIGTSRLQAFGIISQKNAIKIR